MRYQSLNLFLVLKNRGKIKIFYFIILMCVWRDVKRKTFIHNIESNVTFRTKKDSVIFENLILFQLLGYYRTLSRYFMDMFYVSRFEIYFIRSLIDTYNILRSYFRVFSNFLLTKPMEFIDPYYRQRYRTVVYKNGTQTMLR